MQNERFGRLSGMLLTYAFLLFCFVAGSVTAKFAAENACEAKINTAVKEALDNCSKIQYNEDTQSTEEVCGEVSIMKD